MNQGWFEMPEIRRRKLANTVWIPLKASHRIKEIGRYGHAGYKFELYRASTLAIPVSQKQQATKLGWGDFANLDLHTGYVENGDYIPADTYCYKDVSGLRLVLEQYTVSGEKPEWHLHQDFVLTLGLKREGNSWLRPDEGYVEVARISEKENGAPYLLEVRALHLKDYLCARGMCLYIVSYRQRAATLKNIDHITWPTDVEETHNNNRWRGYTRAIHEGGMEYGEEIAVARIERTDVDPEEDVPVFGQPTDENTAFQSWTKKDAGQKLYIVKGEFWHNEWIDPASRSPIVRRDKIPSTVSFITDAEGKTKHSEMLIEGGRWLWFRPEVMPVLAHRRGGSLKWHTRDTGEVGCSPGRDVHFGINSIGLINVYAKDIALLDEWEQKIWAGHNVPPEGKVSEELLSSQVKGILANTKAPEKFFPIVLSKLNNLASKKLKIILVRQHERTSDIMKQSHRFRSTNTEGLFALAKDLNRLTAESINVAALRKSLKYPKSEQRGSIKLLENLLALRIHPNHARTILSPLAGIYELRQPDAHLVNLKSNDAFRLAQVDRNAPFIIQGYQLLHACVSSIDTICQVLESWPDHCTTETAEITP